RIAAMWATPRRSPRAITDEKAICRAASRVARYVPGVTCLTQALTAWVLLSRRGVCSSIRFGVAPDGRGRIAAHAWVEAAPAEPGASPRVLIGGDSSPRRFVELEASSAGGRGGASFVPHVACGSAPALHS